MYYDGRYLCIWKLLDNLFQANVPIAFLVTTDLGVEGSWMDNVVGHCS